jgi:hypothetical protein
MILCQLAKTAVMEFNLLYYIIMLKVMEFLYALRYLQVVWRIQSESNILVEEECATYGWYVELDTFVEQVVKVLA